MTYLNTKNNKCLCNIKCIIFYYNIMACNFSLSEDTYQRHL